MTFRCATAREERGEALSATASTVRTFLLMEDPGPWGPHVLHSRRLPDAVRPALRTWSRELGLRPLLVRRHGRDRGGPRLVAVVNARHGWTEATTVTDLAAVADLDLTGLLTADGVGLECCDELLLLVCTHGAHDPCCAERGRAVAAALAARWPDLVWEASHLGGDRFAGNLLALPRGDYFGGLDAETGPDAVARYLSGELDLAHHRGRSTQAWPVQAAVHAAREQSGDTGIGDVLVRRVQRGGGLTLVHLEVRGEPRVASVRVEAGADARLTCHAEHAEEPPRHVVRWIEP